VDRESPETMAETNPTESVAPYKRRLTDGLRISDEFVNQLCSERTRATDDGDHRCYLLRGHTGRHRCGCEYEWAAPRAAATPQEHA
jgi:hypothetical protein